MTCPYCGSDFTRGIESMWNEGLPMHRFASDFAPPEGKRVGAFLGLSALGVFALFAVDNSWMIFLAVCALLLCIPVTMYNAYYNLRVLPGKYKEWRKTRYCPSCGKQYIPTSKAERSNIRIFKP